MFLHSTGYVGQSALNLVAVGFKCTAEHNSNASIPLKLQTGNLRNQLVVVLSLSSIRH
jgi:hypothetical protein